MSTPHVLTFRFGSWSGWDVFRNFLPEGWQAAEAARRVWPGGVGDAACYVVMPGGCYRVVPGGARLATPEERREAVVGLPV